ncbi:M15 family metallopeptidase [Tenacibaculum sp. FZY0031]|uniref:M15 family metallopeptidase n=1 Tax=unclassified Tenacibaculum TaxID=2635139 RepID=UPI002ECD25C1|nr:M15 family metallopeptidase [Tenacibaculum sp. FZY0031]
MKWILTLFLFTSLVVESQKLPDGFSYIKEVSPTIQGELRYCHTNNFMGVPVNGYEENTLIATTPTAKALKKVQDELASQKLGLKVYDAYRPQTAVNHFVKWARVINDTLMKQQYYPDVNKRHLFKLGYISSKSGHSRGSTVDLTIIHLETGKELDMGSPYDFFGVSSHITYENLTKQQKKNRQLLQKIMRKHGFRSYSKEWWHFTLRAEPFPKTFFDFPVK